jgi:hypothetical protein
MLGGVSSELFLHNRPVRTVLKLDGRGRECVGGLDVKEEVEEKEEEEERKRRVWKGVDYEINYERGGRDREGGRNGRGG